MRAFSIKKLPGWKTAAVRVFAQRVRLSGAASSCVSAKNILPEVNGMEKISRRIFSLFIVALLFVTLIPMGAFAEENMQNRWHWFLVRHRPARSTFSM